MEPDVDQPEVSDKKPTSVPALGLAIACLGGMTTFFSLLGACMLTLVDVEGLSVNDPAPAFGFDSHAGVLGIFAMLRIVCFLGIIGGVVYVVGGIYLRKFRLWANRLLCITAGLGVVIAPLFVSNIFNMFPLQVEQMFSGILVYVIVESALPAGALIWFLNSKNIRPHFT